MGKKMTLFINRCEKESIENTPKDTNNQFDKIIKEGVP